MTLIRNMTPNEACACGFGVGLGLVIGSIMGAPTLMGILGICAIIGFVAIRALKDKP